MRFFIFLAGKVEYASIQERIFSFQPIYSCNYTLFHDRGIVYNLKEKNHPLHRAACGAVIRP